MIAVLKHQQLRGRSTVGRASHVRGAILSVFLLSILALSSGTSSAQSCQNVGPGFGSAITNGGIECISPVPGNASMPSVTLTYSTGPTCNADTAQMAISLSYNNPNAHGTVTGSYGYYESEVIPAGSLWLVDWTDNLANDSLHEGGAATVYGSVNGAPLQQQFQFYVAGVNPSLGPASSGGQIAQAINILTLAGHNIPWWMPNAMYWETGGATQFNPLTLFYNGTYGSPDEGGGDGWGLTQLDGSYSNVWFSSGGYASDEDLWDYNRNIRDGSLLAYSKEDQAYDYWNGQFNNMLEATGTNPVYPTSLYLGPYCNFQSWTGSETNTNTSYWNAEWITEYNSGHFYEWTGSYWAYVAPNTNYAQNVCQAPSAIL